MIASVQFVQDTYKHFNDMCFGGKLPEVPVVLCKARTFLGKTEYKVKRGLFGKVTSYYDLKLKISTTFDLSQNELEDVIIHEMIHCYILFNGLRDSSSHGKLFRRMMSDINSEYGRNITIRHKLTGDILAGPVNGTERRFICVSRLSNGNYGITVCSESRMPEISRKLPLRYKIENMEWFSSDDPFFRTYPKSRSAVIYKVDRKELKEHLVSAQSID